MARAIAMVMGETGESIDFRCGLAETAGGEKAIPGGGDE
jgi:hypothetical protein